MQAVGQHQPESIDILSDLSDFDFSFEMGIDLDVYDPFVNAEPLPNFNLDPETPEPESAVNSLECNFTNTMQTETVDPFDLFTVFKPTTDVNYELPPQKVRKPSASRWVPCAPPPEPQLEPSRWVPIAAPCSNLVPSFAVPTLPQYYYPDPETFGLPYYLPSPHTALPLQNFRSITPPGRQISSLPMPSNVPGTSATTFIPPPPGRFQGMAPVANMTGPDLQQGKKRKQATAPVDEDKDIEAEAAIFSGRRPPKKLGRPYACQQTKERREKNKRRAADYHRRKNDPVYKAKCAQWTKESAERKRQRDAKAAAKTEEVPDSPATDTTQAESPEYVLGGSSQPFNDGDGMLRRSSRQSKPRFPNLEF